ncbi:MAG TPA: methyltransferase dimerization domain-containing protein, partial [Bryobacteraceae bacterium]|nr:methyltransferase dimerization domain-containing protein [Bryobacteraceae bacterium]
MPTATKPAGSSPAVTPERLQQLSWSFASPLILSAAVEIGLFDHLETPRTPAEMSAATGASERGLRALMNALVGLELLSKD